MKILRFATRFMAAHTPPRRCICACCGKRLNHFTPYGSERAPLMMALECVGSRVDAFFCPRCRCHDRERHLLLYLQRAGILKGFRGKDILHFAPEARISARIAHAGAARYVRGDLHPKSPEILPIDMLAIPFEDESFDFIIANHVLEHVDDDIRALQEVHRILRAGGSAILQTPYSPVLEHTWHDKGISTAAARFQAYGQGDHVRLFGRDIFERLASTGLESNIHWHDEVLADIDPDTYGVNRAEPLFLYTKPSGKTAS